MKRTTAENEPQTAAKLHDLVQNIAVAMVVTVTPDGDLRSRPMLTRDSQREGELCFVTSNESAMAGDVAEEHGVNVVYADPARDRYVSVSGRAEFDQDRAELERVWDPALQRYFPKGLDDPRLALLRVRIETAEFWDGMGMTRVTGSEDDRSDSAMAQTDGDAAAKRPKPATGNAGASPMESGGEHTQIDIRATPASG